MNKQEINPELFDQLNSMESKPVEELILINPAEANNVTFAKPEPEPVKKETRGRKSNAEKAAQGRQTQPAPKPETGPLPNQPQYVQNPQQKMTLASLLPADSLIVVVDKGMSLLVPLLMNWASDSQLTPDDFKLNAEEKKILKEPLAHCAERIPINLENPWVALAVTAVAIYGGKALQNINFENLGKPAAAKKGRPRKTA